MLLAYKPKHSTYKTKLPLEYYTILSDLNKSFTSLFWSNNLYLRRAKRISKEELLRSLRAKGFKTTSKTIKHGEEGKLYNFSLLYLQAISYYWSIPLVEMLFTDLSKQDTIK